MAAGVAATAALLFAACGGDDGGAKTGSGSQFCTLAQTANDKTGALGKLYAENDATTTEKALADALSAAKDAQRKAPAEIKDDVDTAIAGLTAVDKILKKYDYDFGKAAADPDFATLSKDTDYQTASKNLDQYLKDECGIGTDTTVPGDTKDTAAPGTTEPTGDTSSVSGGPPANVDQEVAILKQFFPKLSDDQLRCLVEKGLNLNSGGTPGANILSDCKIALEDMKP
jgi:hypothetical protein